MKQVAKELVGLVIALVAGGAAVGVSFGVAAIVRSSLPKPANVPASAQAPTAHYTAQMITTGSQLYSQYCAQCHGANGAGAFGPNLHNSDLSDTRIASIISNGKGPMPPFKSKLNDAQTNNIAGFVKSLK